jgi:tetratricopeptide (TPR) repeat protein
MIMPNVTLDADLPVAPDPTNTPSARELNHRGIACLQSGDVAGALADFAAAAKLDASYAEPFNNAGLVRQMLGRLTDAVADFNRALAVRPDYPEALMNRGRARQALGDAKGAREDFDRALSVAPHELGAAVLHNRGMLRQDNGDLQGALADFDRALEINPEHTSTYVARGQARKEIGDLDGAIADFDKALELNPADGLVAIYHGRGGVRVLRNDFAGALADYDKALALAPDKFFLYISRGNTRYHRRDAKAILDFRMAFRLDPEGAARDMLRIFSLDIQHNPEAVLENCTKHLRINDRDVLAYARRGLTLLLLGRDAEAEPDLARTRKLLPDMVRYLERFIAMARPDWDQTALQFNVVPQANPLDAVFSAFGASA